MVLRVVGALLVALLSVCGYCGLREENPVTGETQAVAMSPEQEIAMGLQAAPRLARQYGGIDPDPQAQALVDRVGNALVSASAASESPYRWEFHLLDDAETINAFALPGGQIFLTEGLLRRLGSEGQLAGVLAHEIGHVLARHGAEQLAKAQLMQGLTGAAVIATYDPSDPSSRGSAAVAAAVAQLVNMRFGREDELQSDQLGVRIMSEAGYDPRSLMRVMEVLAEAGGPNPPEFFSTHPNPNNRIRRIEAAIEEQFPNGVPAGLAP